MNQKIATIKASGLIIDCEKTSGSLLLLVAKPQQED